MKRRSEVVALETDQPQGAGGCWRLSEVVALEFGTVIGARGCRTRIRLVDRARVHATNGKPVFDGIGFAKTEVVVAMETGQLWLGR